MKFFVGIYNIISLVIKKKILPINLLTEKACKKKKLSVLFRRYFSQKIIICNFIGT